ncbi:hypothetical protein EPA93_30875 [Ktedonosporobacter rubrisoli]|uniref:SMP-30/Gluconolactonase/LRE-like region domain-containing protein n=1 Tax=Ktedonosporobacter rubrisoli TaxID=2509675 RepID=A0A4P6JYM3_KTERU|nr:NHL repeat-containing protein [Ktedonosporobacter rubrisoli]QBD80146.1 hypothetical protein EPA93_30875 [Ktedonosporobacter rubrisoli]
MFAVRASVICTRILCLFCLFILSACAEQQSSALPSALPYPTQTATRAAHQASASMNVPPTLSPNFAAQKALRHYRSHILLRRFGRPNDLAFDSKGHLLFSDSYNGTINRLNANGTVTILLRGMAGPAGLVVGKDGSLIIAEQRTNRILFLKPRAPSPSVLRTLPGNVSQARCKNGIDGIALDPITETLILPDSPTGDVYRMSLDGKTLTRLATGIVRPVDAAIDQKGNIYVTDECGGALWRITPEGKKTRFGGFGRLNAVAIDSHGNIFVTDLSPKIHALIYLDPQTDKREVLIQQGLLAPQGLAIDAHDRIFLSDSHANIIMELIPAK